MSNNIYVNKVNGKGDVVIGHGNNLENITNIYNSSDWLVLADQYERLKKFLKNTPMTLA